MNVARKISAVMVAMALVGSSVYSFAPTNFFEPYNANLHLFEDSQTKFRVGTLVEYGATSKGYDGASRQRNILQLHNESESVLAMLDTPVTSRETTITTALGGALRDTNLGKVKFAGSFDQTAVSLFSEFKLPIDFFSGHTKVSFSLPICHARISDVSFTDLTDLTKLTAVGADKTFHNNYLTSIDVLKTTVATRGDNLDLSPWSKTGPGDLAVLLTWDRLFKESKKLLKTVEIYFKAGVSFPTGCEKDIDKAFSMPLGNNGAFGIPVGLGIGLNYAKNIKIGADVAFLALLDKTGEYRLKNAVNQTEHLFLYKGRATKSHGLEWTFNFYAQAVHFIGGLSLKTGYEYTKHDNDSLTPKTNAFDASIVNSANSLTEWNKQHLIFQLNWDSFEVKHDMPLNPQVSLFYKVPINGKNIIAPYTFGGQLALNF